MIDRIHDSEEQAQMQKLTGIITLSAVLLLSSGCSYFGVYKRDIPQGNLVTDEMVDQLQPGMSRDQVVGVMGRPLLEAPFDANQWDYVFRLDEAYGEVDRRRVTLTFSGDRLSDVSREGEMDEDIELERIQSVGPQTEGSGPEAAPQAPPETQQDGEGRVPQGGETSSQPSGL
jgi:outer membrane protein assembly factor BamE